MALICIMGSSGTGKDTLIDSLCDEFEVKRVVPYTTRKMREGEVEGKEYHFVSEEKLDKDEAKNEVIECRLYRHEKEGTVYYYTKKEDLDPTENYAIITTPDAYPAIKQYFEKKGVFTCGLYLQARDEVRKERILSRGDNEDEVNRRIKADNMRNMYYQLSLFFGVNEDYEYLSDYPDGINIDNVFLINANGSKEEVLRKSIENLNAYFEDIEKVISHFYESHMLEDFPIGNFESYLDTPPSEFKTDAFDVGDDK